MCHRLDRGGFLALHCSRTARTKFPSVIVVDTVRFGRPAGSTEALLPAVAMDVKRLIISARFPLMYFIISGGLRLRDFIRFWRVSLEYLMRSGSPWFEYFSMPLQLVELA